MTVNELYPAIGKPVFYIAGNMKFLCTVVDVKTGYGKPRFLIRPAAGHGEQWVEFTSIERVEFQRVTAQENTTKRLMAGGFGFADPLPADHIPLSNGRSVWKNQDK